jgi:hypothetical protein
MSCLPPLPANHCCGKIQSVLTVPPSPSHRLVDPATIVTMSWRHVSWRLREWFATGEPGGGAQLALGLLLLVVAVLVILAVLHAH